MTVETPVEVDHPEDDAPVKVNDRPVEMFTPSAIPGNEHPVEVDVPVVERDLPGEDAPVEVAPLGEDVPLEEVDPR
jgi:hypothetical protein